ncbi:hypothetical protein ACHAXM_006872 [Skeletonema potamos]
MAESPHNEALRVYVARRARNQLPGAPLQDFDQLLVQLLPIIYQIRRTPSPVLLGEALQTENEELYNDVRLRLQSLHPHGGAYDVSWPIRQVLDDVARFIRAYNRLPRHEQQVIDAFLQDIHDDDMSRMENSNEDGHTYFLFMRVFEIINWNSRHIRLRRVLQFLRFSDVGVDRGRIQGIYGIFDFPNFRDVEEDSVDDDDAVGEDETVQEDDHEDGAVEDDETISVDEDGAVEEDETVQVDDEDGAVEEDDDLFIAIGEGNEDEGGRVDVPAIDDVNVHFDLLDLDHVGVEGVAPNHALVGFEAVFHGDDMIGEYILKPWR